MQVFGAKLQLRAPSLAAFAAELLQAPLEEGVGAPQLLCPSPDDSLVAAVHCRLLDVVSVAGAVASGRPASGEAGQLHSGEVPAAAGAHAHAACLCPRPGRAHPSTTTTINIILTPSTHKHTPACPAWHLCPPLPQVRAYWNVKGAATPASWQGTMRGYYAASHLTHRQALGLRWQHGPPAVAGEIFTRPVRPEGAEEEEGEEEVVGGEGNGEVLLEEAELEAAVGAGACLPMSGAGQGPRCRRPLSARYPNAHAACSLGRLPPPSFCRPCRT